jgi:ABC-type transporter Mla subunit MlaD
MPLQDLTPQLRTRLSRMERAVGWFVIFATGLLLFGFGYYLYKTAQHKGWFLRKISYQTCVSSGAGLKLGDPVKLMGFDVGEITAIIPNAPYEFYNITIRFRVKVDQYNYQGYIWSDSKVKVNSGDLLGNRYLEITKGREGIPTIWESDGQIEGILRGDLYQNRFDALTNQGYSASQALKLLNQEARTNPVAYYTHQIRGTVFYLEPIDSPAIADRLDKIVGQAEAALPNILNLTNSIAQVLSNSINLTSNLDRVASDARPAVSNLALLTSQWNRPGALGEWLLPTNLNAGLDTTLLSAQTNLAALAISLDNLGDITSNLNRQVQANTNILSSISRAIVDADDLVQGLKRHWFIRSAFKQPSTNNPSAKSGQPLLSPRQKDGW